MKLLTGIGVLCFSAVASAQTILLEIDGSQIPGAMTSSLVSFPDVDGDGVKDILASGTSWNSGPTGGQALMFSGGDGHLIYTVPGSAGASFGRKLAVLGDVDGDGVQDWGCVQTGHPKNSILVFSGVDGGLIYGLRGEAGLQRFWGDVHGLDDWNGDGIMDWATSLLGGEVQVRSGVDGALLRVIAQPLGRTRHGYAYRGAGDWDGDGQGDMWVWDPAPSVGGLGRVVLYSGAAGGAVLYSVDFPNDPGAGLWRPPVGELMDWNGDGLADLEGVFADLDGHYRVYSATDGSLLLDASSEAGFNVGRMNIGDVTGDGIPDLGQTLRAWIQTLDGVTGEVSSFTGSAGHSIGWGAPFVDYNQDGYMDFLVSWSGHSYYGTSDTIWVVAGRPGSPEGESCDNPLVWFAEPPMAFDTSASGNSSHTGATPCLNSPANDIFVLFPYWEGFEVTTSGANFDTIINVFDGLDCNAPCVASNDDSPLGGTGSRVHVSPANVPSGYAMLQVSGVGGQSGQGVLAATIAPLDCLQPLDNGFGDNHSCATAALIGDGTHQMYAVSGQSDYFTFCIPPGGSVRAEVGIYEEYVEVITIWDALDPNCGDLSAGTHLSGGYANGRASHFNSTNQVQRVILETPSQDPTYYGTPLDCAPYSLSIRTTLGVPCPDEIGSRACNAEVNSMGQPASLAGWGSPIAQDNSFWLIARGLPQSQAIYFLASRGAGLVSYPAGSDGNLCLGGGQPLARLHDTIGSSVTWSYPAKIELDAIPEPPLLSTSVASGETWYFQGWFRDGTPGGSNFTDSLEVLFQ